MYIKSIFIKNFRNIKNAKIDFNENYNILFGNNAQGKTNILESVYYLIGAKSHRENSFVNLINYNENTCIIKGKVFNGHTINEIEIALDKNNKKTIKINNGASSAADLFEQGSAVMFSPDDLRLIKDGPEKRRRFLDATLSKIDFNYKKALYEYERLLKQRNAILKKYFENKYNKTIEIFDHQLCASGTYIIRKRLKYLYEIEKTAQKIHNAVSGEDEKLKILYQSSVIDDIEQTENLSEIYKSKLNSGFEEDIKKSSTSAGPHTDDINIFINDKYCKKFSSQGQQKTASIALKLSEAELYNNYTGDYPVVLLDDVLSELDKIRQERLIRYLQGTQVLLTDTSDKAKQYLDKNSYKLFKIENGCVSAFIE
jgi:DNA replication and repair protein RecF